MRHENQHWDAIHVYVEITTAGAGQTGLSPTARIERISDGAWWDGATWQGTPTDVAMVEVSSSDLPGVYVLEPSGLDYADGADGYRAQVIEATNTLRENVFIDQLLQESWADVRADFAVAGTFGEALQSVLPGAAAIADAVWDEALAGHVTAGTSGAAQNTLASLPNAAAIADAVWDEALGDHASAGSTGEGLAAAATGANPAAIADAVWDEALAGHVTAGSSGAALTTAGSAASPAAIADAVWDEAKSGHATTGTFGYVIQVAAGLVQQNQRLKNPSYDADGRLLSAQLVLYPTSSDAVSDTNALATLTLTHTYDGDGNLASSLTQE